MVRIATGFTLGASISTPISTWVESSLFNQRATPARHWLVSSFNIPSKSPTRTWVRDSSSLTKDRPLALSSRIFHLLTRNTSCVDVAEISARYVGSGSAMSASRSIISSSSDAVAVDKAAFMGNRPSLFPWAGGFSSGAENGRCPSLKKCRAFTPAQIDRKLVRLVWRENCRRAARPQNRIMRRSISRHTESIHSVPIFKDTGADPFCRRLMSSCTMRASSMVLKTRRYGNGLSLTSRGKSMAGKSAVRSTRKRPMALSISTSLLRLAFSAQLAKNSLTCRHSPGGS